MKLLRKIFRKYFFKYTSWSRYGWSKEEMTDYYFEGN